MQQKWDVIADNESLCSCIYFGHIVGSVVICNDISKEVNRVYTILKWLRWCHSFYVGWLIKTLDLVDLANLLKRDLFLVRKELMALNFFLWVISPSSCSSHVFEGEV